MGLSRHAVSWAMVPGLLLSVMVVCGCSDTSFSNLARDAKAKNGSGSDPDDSVIVAETQGTSDGPDAGDDEIDEASGGADADPDLKTGDGTVTVDCAKDAVVDAGATFKSPLLHTDHVKGDMVRKYLDTLPATKFGYPDDKHRIQNFVNELCLDDYSESGTSLTWHNPVISADTDTRDVVCKLYGYSKATNDYGYFHLASAKNDWTAVWDKTAERMSVNLSAAGPPTYNFILVWVGCEGKVHDSCTDDFKKKFTCKP